MTQLEEMGADIRRFVTERGWDAHHNPKDLAMALAVEAAEVLEPPVATALPAAPGAAGVRDHPSSRHRIPQRACGSVRTTPAPASTA